MIDFLTLTTSVSAIAGLTYLSFLLRPAASRHPTSDSNHTIPHKAALAIATGIATETPAIFHGGCNGCIWRYQNTTHAGIAFCRGCSYFSFNQSLPDKSITEYELEKL